MDYKIFIPKGGWNEEKKYVVDLVFQEHLEIDNYKIYNNSKNEWKVIINEKEFIFPSIFFPLRNGKDYLKPKHLNKIKVSEIKVSKFLQFDFNLIGSLPILFSKNKILKLTDIDIFGTIFFIVTRYEEVLCKNRDLYKRFTFKSSILRNFVERPIVDEYIYLFKAFLIFNLPLINFKKKKYKFILTHDVDVPTSWVGEYKFKLLRRIIRSLVLDRSINKAIKYLISYYDSNQDPYFCFDWIMNQSEKYKINSKFFFITKKRHEQDFQYDLKSKIFRILLQNIIIRGHEVGLHGSYLSYNKKKFLYEEKLILENIMKSEIYQNRQHFLRFEVPKTWSILDELGIKEDYSLGYAEKPGFRAGTAIPFKAFDLNKSICLDIKEYPLICMENSLLDQSYLGLSHKDAFNYIDRLVKKIKIFGGNFTLLWHNHFLISDEQKKLYKQILKSFV